MSGEPTGLDHVKAFASQPGGLFGRSIEIICGRCKAPSTVKLHNCAEATVHQGRIVVFCSRCETWNLTDLVFS